MVYLNDYFGNESPLKLDLGSGIYPKIGFIGVDNFVGIRSQTLTPELIDKSALNVIQHNLEEGIPFDNDSINEIVTSHFLEHCVALDKIFDEVHRVLKEDCTFEIFVPYANSAEGMYPGHNIYFTEKWFLNNLQFNKLFKIKEIIFYESDYYHDHKEIINKFFTFDEARIFLFNCCWQMQVISICNKNNLSAGNDVIYKYVSYNGKLSSQLKKISNKAYRMLIKLKNFIKK